MSAAWTLPRDSCADNFHGSWMRQEELGSPALALVRTVCEVFGLDAAAGDETALMRRNLLALVGCRPFSATAAFKVPPRLRTLGFCTSHDARSEMRSDPPQSFSFSASFFGTRTALHLCRLVHTAPHLRTHMHV